MPKQMTPEEAINAATRAEGAYRVFDRGDTGKPQFRVEPTDGGYFMEEALALGKFWMPRAFALTRDGLNADDVPTASWAERKVIDYGDGRTEPGGAPVQAAAFEAIREAGLDPLSPLKDIEGHESPGVRKAVRDLMGLGYLLVWPAEIVAQHIGAYVEQWAVEAEAE